MKEILPPGSKPNREGKIFKLEEAPNEVRKFQYDPMPQFTEWPGNEEAQGFDFTAGCAKNEDGSIVPFEDTECVLHFPPSFKSFVGEEVNLCRPE